VFKPSYKITDKIANDLSKIAELRTEILGSPIAPKLEFNLKREAVLDNTHSSTAIEGNKLTLEQVGDLAKGKDVAGTKKDKKEVLNYLAVLESIPEYAKHEKMNEKLILDIHKGITKGTLEQEADAGVYRDRQVFIGKTVFNGTTFKQEVVYTPPTAEEVPFLMDDWLAWINSEEVKNIHPVLYAGIGHYEFVRIHPFIDGNGRTTRMLVSLLLYKRGFDAKRIFHLDDYYNRDRKAYYSALGSVDKELRDLTNWLEYFTEGVRASLEELKKYLADVLGIIKKRPAGEDIELSSRQMGIIKYVHEKGKITNRELQEMLHVSHETAHKEFVKLLDLEILSQKGAGRGAYYELVDD